ncbi:hypothetical protein [Millisia brevis]|uniref:hypothetical protein n=1 Tax=Millisia brevis TaxID=264148 RepID=UPI000834C418|nr:hypothetical protein [Millisia brevis]
MTTLSVRPAQPAGRSGILLAATALLLVGVFVLPVLIAEFIGRAGGSTIAGLPNVAAHGFDRWVSSGSAEPGAALSSAVEFWRLFHGIKAVLAIGLLALLVVLSSRILAAYRTADTSGRRRALAAGAGASALTGLAIVLVIANIQGMVAPLSSVLSFLPAGDPTPAMIAVHDDVVAGTTTAVGAALIDDFRLYHLAIVVCAVPIILGLIVAGLHIRTGWQRLPTTRRRRTDLLLTELPVVVIAVLLIVVVAANISTVLDTAPALAAFLGGAGT